MQIFRRQHLVHDSTEFYVQYAEKFMHQHENLRRKPLKGKDKERKGEGRLDILSRGLRVPSNVTGLKTNLGCGR